MSTELNVPSPLETATLDAARLETQASGDADRLGRFGFLKILGPGLITGASDDDPSGIATYSQAGAQFGYSMGWTMLFKIGRAHV